MNINAKSNDVKKDSEKSSENINFLKVNIFEKLLSGNLGIILILVLLIIVFWALNPQFTSVTNIMNIGRQTAVIAIIAAGMTFAILIAGIDLSVGAIVAMAGVAAALMMKMGLSWILASIIGVLVGALVGLFNGAITAAFELPPLLVTLGCMNIIRGLAYVITNGRPVWGLPDSFANFAAGNILLIPTPIVIMIVVYIISWFILKKTVFGINVYAVGDNIEAARLSGINVKKVQLMALMYTGLFTGVAGIITASRLFSGQPMVGQGYELDAIAAVVLGGTSLAGGEGNIWGSLVGAIIIGVIHNGLNLIGMSPYIQIVLIGVIIVLAIIFDRIRKIVSESRKVVNKS